MSPTMTSTLTHARPPTWAPRAARFSERSRPLATTRGSDWTASVRTASVRHDALRVRTVARVKLMAATVALLAMAVVVLVAPPTVLIPLGIILATGLFVGALLHTVDVRTRWRSATPDRPDRPEHRTRRNA